MNFHKITLKYLGWCPGIEAAASFIPDHEVSNRKVILLTSIAMSFIVFMAGSYIVATPESYSWDISFEDAPFNELNKKYLVDKTISFSGIYEIEVWVDSTENKTTMIQIFQGNLGSIHDVWTFRNGEFVFGTSSSPNITTTMEMHNTYIWRVLSQSNETIVHIRINFKEFNLNYPRGPR